MQNVHGRQPGEVLDLGVPFQCATALRRRCSQLRSREDAPSHHYDALGTGLQAKREPERVRGNQVYGLADDIRRKRHALQVIKCNRDMNDGYAREHAVPELENELERRERLGDDDSDVALAVLLSQKFRLGGSVGLRGSPLVVEISEKK